MFEIGQDLTSEAVDGFAFEDVAVGKAVGALALQILIPDIVYIRCI